MDDSTGSILDTTASDVSLYSLLGPAAPATTAKSRESCAIDNQLAQVRLGIANALYVALHIKHPPTAEHCIRVAKICSAWASAGEENPPWRDELELAALLHDVGKIAVTDSILRKPAALEDDEKKVMDRHFALGLKIVSACCTSEGVLDNIRYAPAWFDGSRPGFRRVGTGIPLGSRMIAIADAFDSMTTDHLYRKALSRERAIGELCHFAGTQFDPELVDHFALLHNTGQIGNDETVAAAWLRDLSEEQSNAFWGKSAPHASGNSKKAVLIGFHQQLTEHTTDGVIFVDADRRILRWNHGAECLTGITEKAIIQKQWLPELLYMRDAEGNRFREENCPVRNAIKTGSQSRQRMYIKGNGDFFPVAVHIVAVIGDDGLAQGATVVIRDLSSEATLEEHVETLHDKATRDPLTKVANRAEFDRVFEEVVHDHLKKSVPCSLVMCDIDRFKRINDTYGHQAGDEALVRFAAVLARSCRQGDLVARYGGEEFALVCVDCGNASATERAERLRNELAQMPFDELGGKCVTASFGVTELQAGDSPETMLRRSDRALLQAKDTGRNRVVQLGGGMDESSNPKKMKLGWWKAWRARSSDGRLLEASITAKVPANLVVEKLRGYVSDHDAEVLLAEQNHAMLRIQAHNAPAQRRRSDRPVALIMELAFTETRCLQSRQLHTLVSVCVQCQRRRDRRDSALESARHLLASLKSYLVAGYQSE